MFISLSFSLSFAVNKGLTIPPMSIKCSVSRFTVIKCRKGICFEINWYFGMLPWWRHWVCNLLNLTTNLVQWNRNVLEQPISQNVSNFIFISRLYFESQWKNENLAVFRFGNLSVVKIVTVLYRNCIFIGIRSYDSLGWAISCCFVLLFCSGNGVFLAIILRNRIEYIVLYL